MSWRPNWGGAGLLSWKGWVGLCVVVLLMLGVFALAQGDSDSTTLDKWGSVPR